MNHYPVYPYHSEQARDFRNHFAAARAAGMIEFVWEGRRYHTRVAGE